MVQVGQPEAPQAIKQPKLEPPQQEALRRVKVLAGGDKTAIEQEFSQSEESSLEQMIQTAAGVRKSLLDLQVPGGANQETFQARLDAKYTEELAKAANPNDPGEIKKARIAAAEAVEKDLQSAFPDFAEQVRDYAPLSSLEKIGDVITTPAVAGADGGSTTDAQTDAQTQTPEAGKKPEGATETTETVQAAGTEAARAQLIDAAQLATNPEQVFQTMAEKLPEQFGKVYEAAQKDIAVLQTDKSAEGQARLAAFGKALEEIVTANSEELKAIQEMPDSPDKQTKLEAFQQRMEVVAMERFLKTPEGEAFKPQSAYAQETQRLIAQLPEAAKTAATNLSEGVKNKDSKGIAKALSEIKKQWKGMSVGEKIGFVLFLIALLQPFAPTAAAAILPLFMTGIPDNLAEGLQNIQRARKQEEAKAATTTPPQENKSAGKVDKQQTTVGGNVVATEDAATEAKPPQDDQSTVQKQTQVASQPAQGTSVSGQPPIPPQGTVQ